MIPESSRIAILADDLTGALDCAAAFISESGERSPFVALRPGTEIPADCGVVSVNADTRRLSLPEAVAIVRETVGQITGSGDSLQYVKIDSTLRGHPGLEIAECAKALNASLVILAPSFPATGRTVQDGMLRVHGVPLAETDVGRDPLSPLETSNVAEIISWSTDLPVHEVSLADVRSGRLVATLQALVSGSAGAPVIVSCDAETDTDLDALIAAGHALQASRFGDNSDRRVLFAGSAGLAFALSHANQSSNSRQQQADVTKPVQFHRPMLVVTASQRTLADQQIAELVNENLAVLHCVEFAFDASHRVTNQVFATEATSNALASEQSVVLRARITGDLAGLPVESIRQIADQVTQQLGQVVASLVVQHAIGGLIIIGGDTAHAILTAIDARGIVLAAEPQPGVPVGTISGGTLDVVTIATKAGAFGDEQTLVNLFDHMNQDNPPH